MQKVCIIIPCYNESERLNFNSFESFLNGELHVDFLFCNDGSTDNTGDLLNNFQSRFPERVSVHNMKQNSGKAEAVRTGILETGNKKLYKYVGFWDADLATPLSEIKYFINELESSGRSIAIGSRWKRLGANIERKGSRHVLGRVFSTFASMILKLPVYDTQCGAKIFSSDLYFLFEEKFITRWLFDLEILGRYRNKYGRKTALDNIIEVPVSKWNDVSGSKLKFKHMIKVPLELLNIYSKYN